MGEVWHAVATSPESLAFHCINQIIFWIKDYKVKKKKKNICMDEEFAIRNMHLENR